MPEQSITYEMFRPPVDRTMSVLDRSFFKKQIPLAAARVADNSNISELRRTLARDLLRVERVSAIKSSPVPADQGLDKKAFLLRPEIRPDRPETWTEELRRLIEQNVVSIVPFDLNLDYDYWTYDDIVDAIKPPQDEHDDFPSGFTIAGHVAHFNMRSRWLPYKHLIADVIIDKSPAIKTVINKIDDVGAENEYRTFNYEVLKGDPSLDVELVEQGCRFRFNFAKVYWNSRLNTEHERLVNLFEPGSAVCDVMAGIGPFAIPAAKRNVFVWANDLNPDSYSSMLGNVQLNKVGDFLKPFNTDGRAFIRQSAKDLLAEDKFIKSKVPRVRRKQIWDGAPRPKTPPPVIEKIVQPKTFQHYVMNLPATATQFLDAFIGLYAGQEELFEPHTDRKLPTVHVYCFSTKSADNKREEQLICEELSNRLKHPMEIGKEELRVVDVRDVAPKKRMFCAEFRLPKEVAFASVDA